MIIIFLALREVPGRLQQNKWSKQIFKNDTFLYRLFKTFSEVFTRRPKQRMMYEEGCFTSFKYDVNTFPLYGSE